MKMAATTKNVVLQQNQAATASSNMQKLSFNCEKIHSPPQIRCYICKLKSARARCSSFSVLFRIAPMPIIHHNRP